MGISGPLTKAFFTYFSKSNEGIDTAILSRCFIPFICVIFFVKTKRPKILTLSEMLTKAFGSLSFMAASQTWQLKACVTIVSKQFGGRGDMPLPLHE